MVGIGPMTQTSRVARVQAITTDMTDADLGRCLPILQRSGMKFFQLRNECAGSQSELGFDGYPHQLVPRWLYVVFSQHISGKIISCGSRHRVIVF